MKKFYIKNSEVCVSLNNYLSLSKEDIIRVQKKLNKNNKFRICAHKNNSSKIHEMIIFHHRDYYVRPHKHINKTESYHVIKGNFDIIIFDEKGIVVEKIPMGTLDSSKNFYYRIEKSVFHTLLIKSKICIFHETTNGPFKKNQTIFAPWAPKTNNDKIVNIYINNLKKIKI